MDPYLRFRLWLRRRWDRVEATMVDSRFVARRGGSDGTSSYVVQEYMVDVPGHDGAPPARLAFKEQTHRVHGDPRPGQIVPVVVNRKRTKAMFDFADPRIDAWTHVHGAAESRKDRDDARFEAKLKDGPGTP